ncbi:MAG: 2-(1,2-epoxy,2-dihydrophenyl)acetyl-CoA isomerase, partial [Actinomycetota bacterium]|nr:2-(1,2-epoxy,2-dihydrophenyl)acetyl-CoA isomerase [Actinomycetota bacterium]
MPIELTINDGVAEIVLNDPGKLNALDEVALADRSRASSDAAEAAVRALGLRGEGRAFCPGRDISHVDPATDDAHGYLADVVTPVLRQISA